MCLSGTSCKKQLLVKTNTKIQFYLMSNKNADARKLN